MAKKMIPGSRAVARCARELLAEIRIVDGGDDCAIEFPIPRSSGAMRAEFDRYLDITEAMLIREGRIARDRDRA